MGLTEILGAGNGNSGGAAPAAGQGTAAKVEEGENRTGLPGPQQVNNDRLAVGGQPLVAASKPLVAAEVVTQALGPSRRDRNVRFVRARSGDSLEQLVRRWCGARDPFLAEANSLNEDLVTLRVGQEVAVPFVEDEVLMALLAPPKTEPVVLNPVANNAPAGTASAAELGSLLGTKVPGAAPEQPSAKPETPSFAVPGNAAAGRGVAVEAGAAVGATYIVKSGDSLWKIAERNYGRQQADRMITAIKDANPGLTDTVRIGQKIVLPKTAP
jgi:nucleoid-associated protein YgaU